MPYHDIGWLEYSFKNKSHLSFESKQSYSTLGDAVLKTVLIELLDPTKLSAREITEKKIAMESGDSLDEIAKQFGLIDGEEIEAAIGAIYLDRGFDIARTIIDLKIKNKLLEKIEKYKDWVSEVKLLLDQYQENLQFEHVEIKEKEGKNGFRVIKVNGVSVENEETFRKLQKAKNKACELAYGELKEIYPSK